MFKKRSTMCKSSFKKLNVKYKTIKPVTNWFFLKNKIILSKRKLILLIKSLRKFVKKNRMTLTFLPKTNLIKSFKSKNARMGNGKGQLKKNIIKQNSRTFCLLSRISTIKLNLLKQKVLVPYWTV